MDKTTLLNDYQKGYEVIIDTLNELPNEVFDYKPSPNSWSVREIIIHIVDSDVNAYTRLRTAIAESGQAVSPYNQDKWACNLCYEIQSIDDNLELFKQLRKLTHYLLLNISDSAWNNFFIHPERGNLTVTEYLKLIVDHVNAHVNRMLRNYEDWQSRSKNTT